MDWLPRDELLTFEEIERVARVLRRALRLRLDPPHRRRADRPGPPARAGRASWPRLGVDLALTTNGATLAPAGRRPRRRRAAPHQHLARLAAAATASSQLTRRDELDRVLDGIDAALAAGLRPGEGQRRADAGRQRRRGRRLRRLRPRAGRRASASSSSCPSTPTAAWTRRPGRRPATRSSPPSTPCYPLEPVARGHDPAERWPLRATARARSASSRGHRAVLRLAATGCGSPPTGSFRTCLFALDEIDLRAAAAGRRHRRRPGRRRSRPTSAAKWAGHQIGQVHFIRPAAVDEPDRRLSVRLRPERAPAH